MANVLQAAAQPVTNSFYCYRELNQIKQLFYDTAHLSFQAQYVASFNDGTKDTVLYKYKVSGNRMFLECSDSTNFVQNQQYHFKMDLAHHNATVSNPVDIFKYVTRVKIMEPSFNRSFVTGMMLTDTGIYRKLSFQFKPASPYRKYDIIYDRVTHLVQAIQYSVDMNGANSTGGSGKMPYYVTISFSNYQTGQFTDNVFSTDCYFIRKQGICNMVAPYTNYRIKNLLNQ
jgi:hypothetical protein